MGATSARRQPVSIASPATRLAVDGGTPVSPEMIPVVSARLGEEEIGAAVEVLRSGQLRQGRKCAEFESEFAAATGADFALTTCNGTTALQLAYEPIIGPGDEVLCPAFGFIATASMILARGAAPVFCDVHASTFNIDPADAARRITPRTTAVVATHLYGNPADIHAVEELADRHGLSVIYDAAQSHLATYQGRGIGAFGHAVTYSFYPTKNMTTGEGGMVTTNDGELAQRIALLRDHGMELGRRYHHVALGYNYRLTDVAAAIGLAQLRRLPERTARRRANAARLTELLAQCAAVVTPVATEGAGHVYHQYTIRLHLGRLRCSRDEFARLLAAENVGSATHYPRAITEQPIIAERVPAKEPMPVSEQLAREVLCLPVHHDLTEIQIERIAEAVAKVASARST